MKSFIIMLITIVLLSISQIDAEAQQRFNNADLLGAPDKTLLVSAITNAHHKTEYFIHTMRKGGNEKGLKIHIAAHKKVIDQLKKEALSNLDYDQAFYRCEDIINRILALSEEIDGVHIVYSNLFRNLDNDRYKHNGCFVTDDPGIIVRIEDAVEESGKLLN